MQEKKKWYRHVLGFRSGSKWKAIVASLFYFFLFIGIVGAILGEDTSTTSEENVSEQEAIEAEEVEAEEEAQQEEEERKAQEAEEQATKEKEEKQKAEEEKEREEQEAKEQEEAEEQAAKEKEEKQKAEEEKEREEQEAKEQEEAEEQAAKEKEEKNNLKNTAQNIAEREVEVINVEFYEDTNHVNVYYELGDNFTKNMILKNSHMNVTNMLEDFKKTNISSIYFEAETTFTDEYGEESQGKATTYDFNKETINQINYDNFDYDNLPGVADSYWEHPDFSR
ncbi:hypothetical protein [Marinococcus luteus]|uniref:hypothetical protein n=1 Tax=Marinococcus luteus TaxID=1122204 RepID=UPI002ACC3BE2|nr:hypothetical protein [Marinococcus luteus]MDZ5782071.1 hypothetical protein [Marinococcus luteus]